MTPELNKALVAAQSELKNPGFDSNNPHFKNRYVSLAAARDAILPVFHKHGLALVQEPLACDGNAGVTTLVMHTSGEERYFGSLVLPLSKNDPQGAGSAITYARRYSLLAIAGVVGDDDDDANEASKQPAPKAAPKPSNQTRAPANDYVMAIATAANMDELTNVGNQLRKESDAVIQMFKQQFKERKLVLEGNGK